MIGHDRPAAGACIHAAVRARCLRRRLVDLIDLVPLLPPVDVVVALPTREYIKLNEEAS
jgi:hypothetical protein